MRAVVSAINTPVAKVRARRAFASAARPLKIEIGGVGKRDGWLLTNVNPVARLYLDATAEWPFEDGAAEYVYSDNVFEHVSLEGGRRWLREAWRCLRPGGVTRIVTPDLRRHVDWYLEGAAAVDGPLAEAYRGLGIPVEYPLDLIRITTIYFGHSEGYIYDVATLTAELEAAGFHSVVECELGVSEHAELRDLDTRDEYATGLMAIEATR